MNIARFEPWSYVDLLNRDLNRALPNSNDTEWLPAVDIIEENSRYVLKADVPGVDVADIEVSMDAGVLTLSGVRKTERLTQDSGMHRSERITGRFARRFTLPESTDTDAITAKCSNGILEVVVPKQPEVQPRRIAVETS